MSKPTNRENEIFSEAVTLGVTKSKFLSALIPIKTAPRQLATFVCAALAAFTHPASAASGDAEAGFDPNANNVVNSTAVQGNGKIVIGGQFTAVGGVARTCFARLNADGTVDTEFIQNANSHVNSAAVQADGKILIGGEFTTVGGVTRNRIARINANGTLDAAFNPNASDLVNSAVVQPDGKIVIGGAFTSVGGVARICAARLNADGMVDIGFIPNPNGHVHSTAVQVDGKIIIGGEFTIISGVTRTCVARLNADGTADMGFIQNANSHVNSTAVQADGKVLIGGEFTTVGGVTRNRIARINANGTLDTGFNPNANNIVFSMAVQADGKILIGGLFTTVGGVPRNRIARLNADGTLDMGFNPNASGNVYPAVQADGKILIAGLFTTVGGVARNRIARLDNDPATQTLSALGATGVQWLRGGTAPEVEQVSFELSTDGGSVWTPLGAGTRIRGGWELNGLSLPASGQIRARARTTGGYFNSSSGQVEMVAVFPAPEIVVEQPDGTNFGDGGAQDFGTVLAGGNASVTFTIKNIGSANLTGLTITNDGTDAADFTVTASPIAPVAGPNGSTTFTVRFAPAVAGTMKTAALHIASNDADESPFDIALTGRAIDPNAVAITQQPTNQLVFAGSDAAFSVSATTGHPPLRYQWRFNGTDIVGATNDSITIVNVQPADAGNYNVLISDAMSSINSASASLSLFSPFITTQPANLAVKVGSNATFTVTTGGIPPFFYQWQFDGATIANQTDSTLLITNVQAVSLGDYTVVITNSFGAVTSTVAALTFLTPPTIVLQPVPVTVIAGENATFTVTVTNTTTLPITYQWRKASTVITNILLNAHTCAFTLYNVQTNITATNGPGGYRVVVMNAANSSGLASPIVALTVITAAPPAALTGVAGNISDSGAMPSGSVDPKGSTTMAHFEYGLTASYGMTTPVVNAGNGTNSIPFSQILTGLLSGTTYHYRLVASNTGGTTSGVDQMFITLAAGPRLALVPDGSGGYFLRFDAIPSLTYRVQRSSSLTGMWDTISNPTAPSSGLVEYHDTTAPPGRAFYRTVQP